MYDENQLSHEIKIMEALKSVFGYEDFNNATQKNATIAVYEGLEDVYICMPPGFDRSLCFQLPAIVHKGKVTIVISPKLSFMKNEVEFLQSKQINARLLSQHTFRREREDIINDLQSDFPTIPLLYSTSDLVLSALFQRIVQQLKIRNLISYIVFDEAHCLSEWGYEYKSEYKSINTFDKVYGNIPRVAVTAAVSEKVVDDICEILEMETPKILKAPIEQSNIYYDVWFLDIIFRPFEHLKNYLLQVLGCLNPSIHEVGKGFAIIYCREESMAETIKSELIALGVHTLTCHHKLRNSARRNVENSWTSAEAYVITTTYDYGFIHKQSIRCIVYWTVPECIPKYYKESLQIRKIDDRVSCRIYFSMKEYSSTRFDIDNHRTMNRAEHIKKRLKEFDKSVSYCLSLKCRHAMIIEYFGRESLPCEKNCDVCEDKEAVEINTFRFVKYSQNVGGIKYNICDIGEDLKPNESRANANEIKQECVGNELQESKANEIAEDKNTVKGIVLCNVKSETNDEQKQSFGKTSSVPTQLSTKDRSSHSIKTELDLKTETLIECTTMKSLTKRYKLNNDAISLEICDSKTNVNRILDKGIKRTRKRRLSVDVSQEEIKSDKRRRIEVREYTVNPNEEITNGNQSVKRVKNDASVSTSSDQRTVEYLMKKYKLNKDAITLVPQKSRTKPK